MMGSSRRKQVTETVTKAVKSAGAMAVATLAVAAIALFVSVIALITAVKHA